MFNPFVKNKNSFFAYSLVWIILIAAHYFILDIVIGLNWYPALIDSLVFNFLYFAIGLSLWYPTKFISFENFSPLKILINHIAAAIMASGVWVLLGYFILTTLFDIPNESKDSEIFYDQFLFQSLIWRFVIGIVFYTVIISINYIIVYYSNFNEKILKEAELKSLVKEIEIKSLKYQINPHFIFNSLNSISSLTISDPQKAQEMTIKLSSFLRNTLSKNETQTLPLVDELANVQLYLDIEKIRFDERFDFSIDLSDKALSQEVPSMILQPLFENAIKHGVYESIEKVNIKLYCKEEKDYIKLTVENNFDPDAVTRKGEGIGLKNIQSRLKLIYDQDNLLTIRKSNNTFQANIFIPQENET